MNHRRDRDQRPDPAMELGKLPPQAVDIEEAVLGACLLMPDAMVVTMGILQADFFYKESHQKIFESITELFSENKPVDLLTVTEKLKSNGNLEFVGGPFYVAQITNKVGSSANTEYHCRIIAEKYMARELIRIASVLMTEAFDQTVDVIDMFDNAQKEMININSKVFKGQARTLTEITSEIMKGLKEVKEDGVRKEVVPTKLAALDKVLGGGMVPDNYICIAARPGMGKTTLMLQIAKNVSVDQGIPMLIFSMEMSDQALVKNAMCMSMNINREKFRNGDLNEDEVQAIESGLEEFNKAPLYIIPKPGLTITEVQAISRRYVYDKGVKVIAVDYLQRMKGTRSYRGNREQEITEISNGLKDLAIELKVPVIPLSQLSRSVERRGKGAQPTLADLRESGAIEQDADVVMFPHRPGYYGITKDDKGENIESLAELLVKKNRDGSTGSAKFTWNSEVVCFDPRESDDFKEDREDYEEASEGGQDDLPF